MTFEQTAIDCADGVTARQVAKWLEIAATCIERACEAANATDNWRITATVETGRVSKETADKIAAISADIMERVRRG